jgi:hypothetical protein
MCHDIQTPHSEDDNLTRRVSVTVSKLPEPKGDNRHQKQTTSRHQIPPVRSVCRRGNRDTAQLRTIVLLCSNGSKQFTAATKNFETKDAPKNSVDTKTDAAIRSIRQEGPNASLKTITETLSISP